jgi:hypothetical protein
MGLCRTSKTTQLEMRKAHDPVLSSAGQTRGVYLYAAMLYD